jgi:hypothetical protein
MEGCSGIYPHRNSNGKIICGSTLPRNNIGIGIMCPPEHIRGIVCALLDGCVVYPHRNVLGDGYARPPRIDDSEGYERGEPKLSSRL